MSLALKKEVKRKSKEKLQILTSSNFKSVEKKGSKKIYKTFNFDLVRKTGVTEKGLRIVFTKYIESISKNPMGGFFKSRKGVKKSILLYNNIKEKFVNCLVKLVNEKRVKKPCLILELQDATLYIFCKNFENLVELREIIINFVKDF